MFLFGCCHEFFRMGYGLDMTGIVKIFIIAECVAVLHWVHSVFGGQSPISIGYPTCTEARNLLKLVRVHKYGYTHFIQRQDKSLMNAIDNDCMPIPSKKRCGFDGVCP